MSCRPACYEHPLPASTWDVDVDGETPRARSERVQQARAVCDTCPLTQSCLADGIAREEHGVWGGELLDAGRVVRLRVFKPPRIRKRAGRPLQPIAHGTRSGYMAELRRGLPTCRPCRAATAAYTKARIAS